jgi:hypothetical protein
MVGRIAVATLALAFGLATAGITALSAQSADLWSVPNVPVDGNGASPTTAKDTALAGGRQRAWTEIFRRLTPSSEWTQQAPIADEVLEPLIKSFDIANERHSSTRYLATVTYVFNAASVRDTLRKQGVQFSESVSKPVLVIALSGTAWQSDSPWGKAWLAQSQRGRLVPVVVPAGDAQDVGVLATVSTAADWTVVKPLADRYGASSVLVAAQSKSANGIQVSYANISPTGRVPRQQAFARQGAEDELILAVRASGQIADTLQEDWKRTTSVDFGAQTSVAITVPYRTLADWVSIRKVLEGTRNIQRIAIDEFDMTVAHVQLDYVGKIDQLQTALAQSNIYLIADDKGNWTLSRNASTAAATSPGPVVP